MFLVSIAAANVFFGASYIVVLTDIQIMDSAKKFSVRSIEILRTEQKTGRLYLAEDTQIAIKPKILK